jgi:hypothetical protein
MRSSREIEVNDVTVYGRMQRLTPRSRRRRCVRDRAYWRAAPLSPVATMTQRLSASVRVRNLGRLFVTVSPWTSASAICAVDTSRRDDHAQPDTIRPSVNEIRRLINILILHPHR